MEFLSNDVNTWTNAPDQHRDGLLAHQLPADVAAFWRGHPFKGKVITLTLAGLFLGLAPAVPTQGGGRYPGCHRAGLDSASCDATPATSASTQSPGGLGDLTPTLDPQTPGGCKAYRVRDLRE